MQQSHTASDLRGIHSLPDGVAWASGTNGTVLHTEDSGQTWQLCAIPPGAEHLDFRGIQAFDAQTAIVMSSGKGDLSRLYKTIDACKTWTLVFTNPDKEGFWDGLSFFAPSKNQLGQPLSFSYATGVVLGDPVGGTFTLFSTNNGGDSWYRRTTEKRDREGGCKADTFSANSGEAVFAASNQSLLVLPSGYLLFVTGGASAKLGSTNSFSWDGALCHESTHFRSLPIAHGRASSGAFAFATLLEKEPSGNFPDKMMIVGGDYTLPDGIDHNAVFVSHAGTIFTTFRTPKTPPHGYRSSVAYSPTQNSWITVGPNGTDVSTDDGRNWHALRPSPADAPDADRNWNALSLPFVVGPHGRIGLLRPEALKP